MPSKISSYSILLVCLRQTHSHPSWDNSSFKKSLGVLPLFTFPHPPNLSLKLSNVCFLVILLPKRAISALILLLSAYLLVMMLPSLNMNPFILLLQFRGRIGVNFNQSIIVTVSILLFILLTKNTLILLLLNSCLFYARSNRKCKFRGRQEQRC